MSGNRRRKKQGSFLGRLMLILFLLILVMLLAIVYIMFTGNGVNSNPVTKTINKKVTETAVEQAISQSTGTQVSIEEIESNMNEEDAKELNDIVDKYSENGLVSEALDVYTQNGGDVDATVQEMKDKVSPEDVEALQELYAKYKDSVAQ